MAGRRTPGRDRSYLVVGTPRLRPCLPGREGGHQGRSTPGRGRSYLAVGTPRLQPVCACRGARHDTRLAARPGCGRSAHAGAGEKLRGCWDAPAAAAAAAALCVPEQEEGH